LELVAVLSFSTLCSLSKFNRELNMQLNRLKD